MTGKVFSNLAVPDVGKKVCLQNTDMFCLQMYDLYSEYITFTEFFKIQGLLSIEYIYGNISFKLL